MILRGYSLCCQLGERHFETFENMMKVILFIGLITSLCGDMAESIRCYEWYNDNYIDGLPTW